MNEQIVEMIRNEQFERSIKAAFSASGPLAGKDNVLALVMCEVGRSFTYRPGLSRDEHFRKACEVLRSQMYLAK